MNRPVKIILIVLAVVGMYLTWTFDHSLWNPDETRDAGIAAEMYREGQYAVPHLNGETFLEKPPLYYWTCAFVYKLTGRVTPGTTRLPSALYGLLGILFTFLIGKHLFNERVGLLAALMLATAAQYFRMSHFAMMDVSLAALVAGALYFYARGSVIGFAVLTVLSFYAKGFLGVLLPGLVVCVDCAIEKKPKELLKYIAVGALLFAAFAGPWFWALWKEGGMKNLEVFVIDNHWKRFVANGSDHTEHFWFYYFLSFPVDFIPWTFFAFGFLWSAYKNPHRYLESRPHRFVAVWFLSLLAFFTVSSSKRSIYMLPLFPAACLMTAAWLEESASLRIRKTALAVAAVVAIGVVAASFTMVKTLDADKTFVPVYEAIRARSDGREVIGFDMSEMERGVFSFYLNKSFRNVRGADELSALIAKQPDLKFVLLANRNRIVDVNNALGGRGKLVYEYRPEKRSRSYILFESNG
jgi:4-amino-4-deoxy-L-arabinose transferase-like glycosyltransferase